MLSLKPWAAALAAASIALTACSSDDTASTVDDAATDAPVAAEGSTLALTGTIGLKFEPATANVDAGDVTVELVAEGVVHNVVIEGVNDDAVIVEAQAGESATGTVTLTAGTYTYYCNVAGHREAGMEGTVTVA